MFKKITISFLIILSYNSILKAQDKFGLSEIYGKWEYVSISSAEDYAISQNKKGKLVYEVTERQKKENTAAKVIDVAPEKTTYFKFNEDKTYTYHTKDYATDKGTWKIVVMSNGSEVLTLSEKGKKDQKMPMYFERVNGKSFISLIMVIEDEMESIVGKYTQSVELLLKYKKVN